MIAVALIDLDRPPLTMFVPSPASVQWLVKLAVPVLVFARRLSKLSANVRVVVLNPSSAMTAGSVGLPPSSAFEYTVSSDALAILEAGDCADGEPTSAAVMVNVLPLTGANSSATIDSDVGEKPGTR